MIQMSFQGKGLGSREEMMDVCAAHEHQRYEKEICWGVWPPVGNSRLNVQAKDSRDEGDSGPDLTTGSIYRKGDYKKGMVSPLTSYSVYHLRTSNPQTLSNGLCHGFGPERCHLHVAMLKEPHSRIYTAKTETRLCSMLSQKPEITMRGPRVQKCLSQVAHRFHSLFCSWPSPRVDHWQVEVT